MVATRGTVVIADWEALPVAVASPDAVPVAPPALETAGFRIVNAAEGEAEAPSPMVEATSDMGSASVCRDGVDGLTLADTGSVANGLTGLLGVAGLARAVADAVGPVGLRAEAGSVAGGATKVGVGDAVHVVDTQLLGEVSD